MPVAARFLAATSVTDSITHPATTLATRSAFTLISTPATTPATTPVSTPATLPGPGIRMARLAIFYDSEFTGLTQDTSLISIALLTLDGRSFYAEFTDFNLSQVDNFINESVLANTRWLADWNNQSPKSIVPFVQAAAGNTSCVGPTDFVRGQLLQWAEPLGDIQIWADHISYDWVLFCQLFGGALSLPRSIYYIPLDLCTLMSCHGYDPDCDRIEFAGHYLATEQASVDEPGVTCKQESTGEPEATAQQHNALFDARVSLACYQRILAETS